MKSQLISFVFNALRGLALACLVLTIATPALADGAIQFSGIGFFAEPGECVHPQGDGADFALDMTGDLEGCLYVFVEAASCTPSGVYHEIGTELFVGDGSGEDTFMTSYRFTAKYQDCANLVGEIVGRCQHPIIAGSGKGIYTGVSGRLDMKDDIAAGNFPYRGHLRW